MTGFRQKVCHSSPETLHKKKNILQQWVPAGSIHLMDFLFKNITLLVVGRVFVSGRRNFTAEVFVATYRKRLLCIHPQS